MAAVRHFEFSKFIFFCRLTSVATSFCFAVQNFTQIEQSVAELSSETIFQMVAVCHLEF